MEGKFQKSLSENDCTLPHVSTYLSVCFFISFAENLYLPAAAFSINPCNHWSLIFMIAARTSEYSPVDNVRPFVLYHFFDVVNLRHGFQTNLKWCPQIYLHVSESHLINIAYSMAASASVNSFLSSGKMAQFQWLSILFLRPSFSLRTHEIYSLKSNLFDN